MGFFQTMIVSALGLIFINTYVSKGTLCFAVFLFKSVKYLSSIHWSFNCRVPVGIQMVEQESVGGASFGDGVQTTL